MHIGILQTGEFPEGVVARQGSYPAFFTRLLQRADPGVTTSTIDVEHGQLPSSPSAAEGWLVTGSRHGAYEDHPWIEPLMAFLRASVQERVPVVGVCFGHQILAQAMGGQVVKSDRGWGLGVHDYAPASTPPWAAELGSGWSGYAIHQDQVIRQPPDSTVVLRSEFCPYAALAYGDPAAPTALGVQPHPEYTGDLLDDMIAVRLNKVVPADVVAQAVSSRERAVDPDPWARTMMGFFRDAAARREKAAHNV